MKQKLSSAPKQKLLQVFLNDSEIKLLDKILKDSPFHTRAGLIRFLLFKYQTVFSKRRKEEI